MRYYYRLGLRAHSNSIPYLGTLDAGFKTSARAVEACECLGPYQLVMRTQWRSSHLIPRVVGCMHKAFLRRKLTLR